MRLLVTRPEEDARSLGRKLGALGHETVSAPLLSIHFTPDIPLSRPGVQAVLATSANGVRAFARRGDLAKWLDVPLLAVGPTTAALARRTGFSDVREGAGDARALADLARRSLVPENGRVIHVSGAATAGDLQGWLAADGFSSERAVLYEARAAEALPPDAAEALGAGRIEGVLFYSRRTAAAFRRICERDGLTAMLRGAGAYCLAPGVADALEGLPFGAVHVARAPHEEAVLALLGARR